MTQAFSLSIFTIESDRKPVLAFAPKRHEDADVFFRDHALRTKLMSASSVDVPPCDDLSILRIRLANAEERALYSEKMAEEPTASFAPVFPVDIDAG
jgi:hypothetical protein